MGKDRKSLYIERYNKLRAEGFSSKEATKLKYRSDKNIDIAIKEYKRGVAKEEKRVARNKKRAENYRKLKEAGYSSKEATQYKGSTKKIEFLVSEFIYERNPSQTLRENLSRYNYLVLYETIDPENNVTRKFLNIPSMTKLSRKEVWEKVEEVFHKQKNIDLYEGNKIIYESIRIIKAFDNTL